MASIKRTITNGLTMEITLTDEELTSIYWEARKLHMKGWVADLLEEYGYPEQPDDVLNDILEQYLDHVEGDRLGELEHEAFEYVMEYWFPEIKAEDEDADDEEEEE